jgi:hypothetical protein
MPSENNSIAGDCEKCDKICDSQSSGYEEFYWDNVV